MDTQNFGGMWVWLIILILFLFNWNWFGGFGGGNNAAWLLNWMNNNNNHDNTVDMLLNWMNNNNNHDNTVDILNNNTQRSQQMFANQNLANQTTLITQGFCNTNNSIEKAILAWQQNTAAIIAASTAGVQRVLDKMCEQETQRLRTELAEARVIANNTQQTADIVNAIRPFPQSAYIVSSPYTSIYPPTTTPTTWA